MDRVSVALGGIGWKHLHEATPIAKEYCRGGVRGMAVAQTDGVVGEVATRRGGKIDRRTEVVYCHGMLAARHHQLCLRIGPHVVRARPF